MATSTGRSRRHETQLVNALIVMHYPCIRSAMLMLVFLYDATLTRVAYLFEYRLVAGPCGSPCGILQICRGAFLLLKHM
ncbi:hypothetical protein GGS24DRAFT_302247 [Hypoxylon argillaceum]|nr:hypothetical protein GGS24DRAFT_302247 [Hypoxylon argillaceum]KAI1156207.1 hypothetical protein F4825DRAFT_317221 [Nemania diffusa]